MEKNSSGVTRYIVEKKHFVRVLVVEDHDLSAHIAERFLKDLGCQVDCAPDGRTAVKNCENDEICYDLIFMDVSLPDIDGYTLVKKIKAALAVRQVSQEHTVPIIALTARDDDENKQRCLMAGMNAVLVKPLLRTTAERILREYVPKWCALNLSQQVKGLETLALHIEGEPINFEYALTIHNGDIHFIKSALQVVIDSLAVELKQLHTECTAQHWDASRVIIHKLQGGTRYFGLMRLDQVCEKFLNIFREHTAHQWQEIYKVLVNEVDKVSSAYQQWLDSFPAT